MVEPDLDFAATVGASAAEPDLERGSIQAPKAA